MIDKSPLLSIALSPAEVEELLSRTLACPRSDNAEFLSAVRKLLLAQSAMEPLCGVGVPPAQAGTVQPTSV